jgi:hypothetical protein
VYHFQNPAIQKVAGFFVGGFQFYQNP